MIIIDMGVSASFLNSVSNLWSVLMLFLIPIGGGIPAGVLLARSRNIGWPVMMILYFISDVVLACCFEPFMLLVIALCKRSPSLVRMRESFRKSITKTTARYGNSLGPLSLILISFGVDPMTGRAAAVQAGHGFVSGWMLAIMGDMIYFTILMISTLWLNNVLGDGTWTTVIILVLMTLVPYIVRRFRTKSEIGS